jgi:hypothetical protein
LKSGDVPTLTSASNFPQAVASEHEYLHSGGWNPPTSFGRLDLPLVAKVAEQAMTFIYNRPQQARAL